jgi:2-amino-4-hydroxy-6-hydroxymethyldihydropteridine diphosphokinase
MKAGVALGSNLGDRLYNLERARSAIRALIGTDTRILSSAVYETEPVDCEPGACAFLNAAVEFEYAGDPAELLRALRKIETDLGRPSDHQRNVSRNIDIDLLYLDGVKINEEGLTLPHPRMHRRGFVLAPLADIDPDLILPGQTKTIAQLLASLGESAKVVRLTSDWESQ